MALTLLSEALAALPGQAPAENQPMALGQSALQLWTPPAEIKLGTGTLAPDLDFALDGQAYGPSYVIKAPCDGVVEYLYSWTGFFSVGQPLIRLYDPQLITDLATAKAVAGKFSAQPFTIALPGTTQMPFTFFPPPTLRAVAPAAALRQPAPPPPAAVAPTPRATLERTSRPAPSSQATLAPAQRQLAEAEKRLADTDQELTARRQLQQSGVLAPEELTRVETERAQAALAVQTARQQVQAAAPAPARSAAAPASRTQAALPPLPRVPSVPVVPAELTRLSTPRWEDVFAPTGGAVLQPLQPPGTVVKKGTPLLKVSNSAWARVRVLTTAQIASRFDRATPLTVNFPALPGLDFVGWATGKHRLPGDERVVVDMILTRPQDRFETQSLLLALSYDSPPAQNSTETQLAFGQPRATGSLAGSGRLFGLLPTTLVASATRPADPEVSDSLTGRLALLPAVPRFGPALCPDPALQARLEQLHTWQRTFVDGLTTAIYDQKMVLSYPREGEMAAAVEKMMKGQVGHDPGYCARTLREALGWGLGDAYQWAIKLPQVGYRAREDGFPRPGDIIVWPFTYGSHHSQHIGVSVLQNGRMMLLSNMEGRLGTSELIGGYIAFYKPAAPPATAPATPAAR